MTSNPTPEWFRLLASWSEELLSASDRFHYLIGNQHQPSKGSYREALLRKLLRRILPDRYAVSTGFIYRGDKPASRQIDVLIWDRQQYSALLEEGESVVLAPHTVEAVIEVKSTLKKDELEDALELLTPEWWINWRHTSQSSINGLKQQVVDVPFRAIFAYTHNFRTTRDLNQVVFSALSERYRNMFGADAKRALSHSGTNLQWSNLVNSICIADSVHIQETHVNISYDLEKHNLPGYAAYSESQEGKNISVGIFCMQLLKALNEWRSGEIVRQTLDYSVPMSQSGVCSFGSLTKDPETLNVWGRQIESSAIWYPTTPLWKVTDNFDFLTKQ